MATLSLSLQQLNGKLLKYNELKGISVPRDGWVKTIRVALGMTLLQLGNKLTLTKQSVQEIEKRERDGTITLNALRNVAEALDMQLVYGFVPKDGSLEALIERKVRELATQIVMRTSNTMRLEDQENSRDRIEKAIEERTVALKNEMPRSLWD